MKKIFIISLITISVIMLTGCGKKEEKLTRVYSYTDDNEINYQNVDEKLQIESTEKDYKKINHNVFLAFDLDKNNIVKNIEICGILHRNLNDEKMFCLNRNISKAKETMESLSNDYELCDHNSFGDEGIDCTGKKLYYSINEDYGIEIGVVDENPFAFERCILFEKTGNADACGSK